VKDAIIVQLTGWFEKKVPKADNYLPTKEGLSVTHLDQAGERVSEPPIVLTLQKSEEIPELCSQRSTLRLRTGREGDRDQMTVHHYLFSAWPDYGVPTQPEHVDGLKKLVTEVGELQRKLKCEVWVHCSAGVGRTGTFVALSSLLNPPMSFSYQYTTALHPSPLGSLPVTQDEVAVTIDNLREQRGQMCQTEAQMELVYKLTNRQPGTAL
jgi:protein-tyrosine phosphatase